MTQSDRRIGNNLVALGTAAVMAVYAAGFYRTRAAAQRFAGDDTGRRSAVPTGGRGDTIPPSRVPVNDDASRTGTVSPAAISAHSTVHASPSAPMVASAVKPVAKPDSAIVSTPAPTPVIPADTQSAAVAAPIVADSTAAQKEKARAGYADGTFTGWGTSRHGDIQASVEIKNGRIVAANITQCLTRYSCSWISALPGQVISRQSAEVDYVTGATQSSNAFYAAIVESLNKAK